jgi:hypothetical protein
MLIRRRDFAAHAGRAALAAMVPMPTLAAGDARMLDQLLAVIVDESKWLAPSMALAAVASACLLYRHRRSGIATRARTLAAMNLFFAITIGTMAFGHLLAVTIKLAAGTLEGSAPAFYLIGIALAVPSWWLIPHTRRIVTGDGGHGRATVALNAWLTVTLLALGIHNLPLAAPGILNIAYCRTPGRILGWTIVATAVLVNAGLFVGALVFLASGQSFEQFSGME